ncbi:MAG: YhfC family intramembrane metalloprotease [Anaerolineales bacterium]|nr:YhfC family intramembrane metalloprotease [Anaerolineales bacterium]
MNILYVTHLLNGLLMILLPVVLGVYLARKFGLGWRLLWIGAAVFILSQIGHLPFNYILTLLFQRGALPVPPEAWRLPFNAVVLGLSAGLWEECARYAAYRWWARDARSWRKGLLMGAGHGGIEAILLGLLVLLTFANMLVARSLDLTSLLPAEQLQAAQAQVQAYWSMRWCEPLFGALERAFTLPFHLAASLLVLQTMLRRQARWLFLAIGWHALLDAVAVYGAGTWGTYVTEALLGGFALASLGIIFALRGAEPAEEALLAPPLPQGEVQPAPAPLPAVDETPENLGES